MKTGSANLTFCVTFHNFSSLLLACLLFCSRLMYGFLAAFWLGICVEVDVHVITSPYYILVSSMSLIWAETKRCDIVGFSKVTT